MLDNVFTQNLKGKFSENLPFLNKMNELHCMNMPLIIADGVHVNRTPQFAPLSEVSHSSQMLSLRYGVD